MADKTKYNIPVFLVLMIISAALFTACNTVDTDYERDNPKDPENPGFVHSKPDMFAVILDGEVINVKWRDNTTYNDGYVIEKAINDTTKFEHFATLAKDAEGFSDNSRKIGLHTYYRISTIEIAGGSEKIVHSEILSLSVDVINWFDIQSNNFSNEITARWRSSNIFVDGFRIEEKSPQDSVYTTIKDLGDGFKFDSINQFKFTSDLEFFRSDVRIVAYQYHDGQKVDINYAVNKPYINGISVLSVTYISETEALIQWQGNVDFAEHYLLEVTRGNTIVGEWEMPATGSYLLEMTNIRGLTGYRVTGKHHGIDSNTWVRTFFFNLNPPTLSMNSSSLDEVIISWEYLYDAIKASMFTLERSTNDFAYEDIAVLSGDEYSFVENDLDPENTYRYRIRTLTSVPSNSLFIRSGNQYLVTDEAEIILPRSSFYYPKFKFIDDNTVSVYGHGNSLFPVAFLNVDNLTLLSTFDSENHVYSFDLSPDGKRAVELVSGNTLGGYDLNIWNTETSTVETVLQDVYVNTTLTYAPLVIRFSPTGEHIATGDLFSDTEINFWNLVTGEIEKTIEVAGEGLRAYYFNPAANEIIIFTSNSILFYDLLSLEQKRRLPLHILLEYRGKLIVSEKGNYLIYNTWNSLYKIDMETGSVLDYIRFNGTINIISSNNNLTEIFVSTSTGFHIINADNFKTLQFVGKSHVVPFYVAHHQLLENTAISITRININGLWKLEKWQKQPLWYEVNP